MSSSIPPSPRSAAGQTPYNVTLPPILHPTSQPPPPLPSIASTTNPHYASSTTPPAPYSPGQHSPQEDGRDLPGGKARKEIKRRTKTGCLTCRSRRIKCDEAKPNCRNCEKSRRDCRGYDPLFVPQKPVSLQPAPAPPRTSTPVAASSKTSSPTPSSIPARGPTLPAVASLRSPPQHYLPPPSSKPPSPPSLPPVSFDFRPSAPSVNGYPVPTAIPPPQPLEPVITYESRASAQATMSAVASASATNRLRFKSVLVDDLFAIDGVQPAEYAPPPDGGSRVTDSVLNEIKILYNKDYAYGMDAFMETLWYSTKGRDLLFNDKDLLEQLAFLVTLMAQTRTEDFRGQCAIKSFEAKIIWRMMCLCRRPAADVSDLPPPGVRLTPDAQQIVELRKRLDVLEHVVCNRITRGNVIATIPYPPRENMSNLKKFEVDFWHLLGELLAIDPAHAQAQTDTDKCLGAIRGLLGQLENRDIIYSILVARHLGGKHSHFPRHLTGAYNNDEGDERTKLFVAKQFIEAESLRATHQVMQRLCNMAINSWSLAES